LFFNVLTLLYLSLTTSVILCIVVEVYWRKITHWTSVVRVKKWKWQNYFQVWAPIGSKTLTQSINMFVTSFPLIALTIICCLSYNCIAALENTMFFIRLEAMLPVHVGFSLCGNMAEFTHLAITQPKMNRYG